MSNYKDAKILFLWKLFYINNKELISINDFIYDELRIPVWHFP